MKSTASRHAWLYAALSVAVVLCSISEALSLIPPNGIVTVTHAAGRMGKVLALQIREDAQIAGVPPEELPRIRAVVRSEAEAASVECDLGGMTLIGGEAAPVKLDWLDIIIVEDIEEERGKEMLRTAFEGADGAILCDASHNEMVWMYDDANGSGEEEVCSISVPAAESKDLSKRLLAEIDAASSSSTLRHVVMRSTMVGVLDYASLLHTDLTPLLTRTIETIQGLSPGVSEEAAAAMGGEAALAGPRRAEEALRSSGINHTILRLGALTDDAGMVPLIFGMNDAILERRIDSTTTRRPPILSRSDAARVSVFLLKEASSLFTGLTVDCSWHPKYGRSSVGSEEAINAACRQDLMEALTKDILLFSFQNEMLSKSR